MLQQVRAFSTTLLRSFPRSFPRLPVTPPLARVVAEELKRYEHCSPVTPDSHIKMANQHIRDLDVASASKEIRLGSSLQLKVFLRTYELDVDSFSMQTNVVNYLTENCVDDGEEFSSNWNCAHCAHKHYDDFEHLLSVSISYDAAVDFCNELYEIVMNKRFDKNHLLAEWKGRWDKELLFPVVMSDGTVVYTRGEEIMKKE
ncbi:unnamed protein product [Meloidogyne enterolobii]|uniref:Uncharacterized protein n=2 Tax=Meloidogyne enterolobii TaxID=390850 RepID=A0ACB1ARB4_MELEN|nr:unnamed protein product [Meloidogyne enterolobii]